MIPSGFNRKTIKNVAVIELSDLIHGFLPGEGSGGHRDHREHRDHRDQRDNRERGGSGQYRERGHRGGPRGGSRGRGGPGGNRPKEPLKFEEDFDFESSNAKFDKENIIEDLKKLNISKYMIQKQNTM